jgi:hypothetical protein
MDAAGACDKSGQHRACHHPANMSDEISLYGGARERIALAINV